MPERGVGRRATRRLSIEPGKIQTLGRIVNGSRADGVLATDGHGCGPDPRWGESRPPRVIDFISRAGQRRSALESDETKRRTRSARALRAPPSAMRATMALPTTTPSASRPTARA